MKTVFTVLVLLTVAGGIMAIDARAQLRLNRVRMVDPQVRRNNRLPPGRRRIDRPLGDPQLRPNRGLNPNQIKRQQLQQRVMQLLGLTQDQRIRMQEIRRSHDDEVIAAGRRLRQARQALDRAIMSEPYNEAEVRRATEALANAHADKIRLDANVRARVRGVLTPDQVLRFHQLQREMRREQREQQRDQDKETGGPRGMNALQPEEDLISLLFPTP